MNKYQKGKQLEIYVAEVLQEIFQETPPIRSSKASSGGERNTEISDITSSNLYCECKNNGKWFSLKVWQKLLNSLPFGTSKIPMYVIEHEIEGKLIVLSLADFCKLLKEKR